ncbi:MAG: sialidase family protein [Planctomycetota bacterium]
MVAKRALALLLPLLAHPLTLHAERLIAVDGAIKAAQPIGGSWKPHEKFVEGKGEGEFLYATKSVRSDFTITAKIAIDRLAHTAPALLIGEDLFGFDGLGKRLFVEGDTIGETKFVGDAGKWIAPDRPFTIKAERRGETLSFFIGGDKVWSGKFLDPGSLPVGFRAHRARLRVYHFTVESKELRPLGQKVFFGKTYHQRIQVGKVSVDASAPPKELVLREKLGLLTARSVNGQLLYVSPKNIFESRATITPSGDYLLLFPEGNHYSRSRGEQNNHMMGMRSKDGGKTWSHPKDVFRINYNQHGFIPLTPKGSKRIYAFGTQPIPGKWNTEKGLHENAPIGFRHSDDDGETWSKVTLIQPTNDPSFTGMSVMRMCETDAGTWIVGSHEADWSIRPLRTRQYLLRSEDRGKTWTAHPGKRPAGWFSPKNRMDEGRPISIGGREVFALFRTPTGFLYSSRSLDDGKTWSKPKATPLVHPDAPPMIFKLSDGKTLAAFHHNAFADHDYTGLSSKAEIHGPRAQVWVALSKDGGRTWSKPRFAFANALAPKRGNAWYDHQCSYIDAFSDRGTLHVFLPHRWKRALYLQIPESALHSLPLEADLKR